MSESCKAAVRLRERHRCARCGVGTPKGRRHWHHRRSRSRRDHHTDCPCNTVNLCPTCHRWVHENPFEAKAAGLIVSRFNDNPGGVTVLTAWGPRIHHCNGTWELAHDA